jgi:hypothetical protein
MYKFIIAADYKEVLLFSNSAVSNLIKNSQITQISTRCFFVISVICCIIIYHSSLSPYAQSVKSEAVLISIFLHFYISAIRAICGIVIHHLSFIIIPICAIHEICGLIIHHLSFIIIPICAIREI